MAKQFWDITWAIHGITRIAAESADEAALKFYQINAAELADQGDLESQDPVEVKEE